MSVCVPRRQCPGAPTCGAAAAATCPFTTTGTDGAATGAMDATTPAATGVTVCDGACDVAVDPAATTAAPATGALPPVPEFDAAPPDPPGVTTSATLTFPFTLFFCTDPIVLRAVRVAFDRSAATAFVFAVRFDAFGSANPN